MFCSYLRGLFLCILVPAWGQQQRKEPASQAELAGISARGRALAEYDTAAWHATDAFLAVTTVQDHERAPLYLARKDGNTWEVLFGKLNSPGDKFLIAFEAHQADSPASFTVKRYEQAKEASGFYVFAAKALTLVREDFKGENRRYNKAVLPADAGKLYVYVYPARTDEKIWVLGGDMRYLVSADGATILDRHRMHNSILEFRASSDGADGIKGLIHSAFLDEVPEDTDVFLAMTFQPAVDHTVITKHFLYGIYPDGTAVFLMTMETFKKIPPSKIRIESRAPPNASNLLLKS
jgi:hypothetical protein